MRTSPAYLYSSSVLAAPTTTQTLKNEMNEAVLSYAWGNTKSKPRNYVIGQGGVNDGFFPERNAPIYLQHDDAMPGASQRT